MWKAYFDNPQFIYLSNINYIVYVNEFVASDAARLFRFSVSSPYTLKYVFRVHLKAAFSRVSFRCAFPVSNLRKLRIALR